MLKNVFIRILEDSRFLRFFAHNWPFGKISHFWQVWSKSVCLVEMHILGVLRSVMC